MKQTLARLRALGSVPAQKRAGIAVLILFLALFPALLPSVLDAGVTVVGWVAAQPLLTGIVVGALLFARRPKTPTPPGARVESTGGSL
ncbi:hypothetical protein [Streptomyces sp. NPDC057545]|uniref:hypothetical protein n=1 Tax=Streptomyces sp. NPDC057545 TaxID=3346164 RepID=UPI0036939575